MSKSNLGQKIKRLRVAKGITQVELARKAGLTWGAVARIEIGTQRNAHLSTRKKLAKALKVDITELLD